MNSRICPSEELLSEYLSGCLHPEDKPDVEKHLAGCAGCRKTIVEAHEILNKPDIRQIKREILNWLKTNRWLLGAMILLILSFMFPKYFLQFLVACLLMGAKWIIDSKTTKMLIMIHQALKSGDKDKADKILSRFEK